MDLTIDVIIEDIALTARTHKTAVQLGIQANIKGFVGLGVDVDGRLS